MNETDFNDLKAGIYIPINSKNCNSNRAILTSEILNPVYFVGEEYKVQRWKSNNGTLYERKRDGEKWSKWEII